jgi:tRNA threonylcarbamoyladenosine biosynthesis protein TsaB
MILTIRTDTPEAEVSLVEADGKEVVGYTWTAGRKLSQQLLPEIDRLVESSVGWNRVAGIVVYCGPGSFTGLRIGVTAANTAAYSLNIPVVGASGDDWIKAGLERLPAAQLGQFVRPEYGSEPNITMPKK